MIFTTSISIFPVLGTYHSSRDGTVSNYLCSYVHTYRTTVVGVLLVFRRRTVRPSVGHSVKNLEFQKKLNENLSPKIG